MNYSNKLKSGEIKDKYMFGYPYMLPTSKDMQSLYSNVTENF